MGFVYIAEVCNTQHYVLTTELWALIYAFCNNLCAEFTKEKVMQVAAWQKWLAHVSSAISSLCNDDEPIIHNFQEVVEAHNTQTEVLLPHQITLAHEISAYKNFLPKWNWDLTSEECLWCTDFTNQNKPKKYANLTEDNWQTIMSFLAGLKWKIHESEFTSYLELTYAFWDAGCRLQNVDENPKEYSKSIRKCINQALKAYPDCPLVPGCQIVKCKSWGRTLPSGRLKGCTPLLELSALKRLAFTVLQGRSHLLSNWDTPF